MKIYPSIKEQYQKNKRLARYLTMAVIIVGIELATFQLIYFFADNYYLATVVSFITGAVMNWVGGRYFIFGTSLYHPVREFIMVLTASGFGLVIQLIVVFLAVQLLGLYPLFGKILSILFSFFWNYWFRTAIVYKHTGSKSTPRPDDILSV